MGNQMSNQTGKLVGAPNMKSSGSSGAKNKKRRLMLEPDASCQTIRAKRRGFIGTVKTNIRPFEQELYIFDDTSGVIMFCMGNTACLDTTPNRKNFPKNAYRVYNLKALGFDGGDAISLYYNGARQTLRFVGNVPKRFVIHDKFVFRVRYSKVAKAWQYYDPVTQTFRQLPFPSSELTFHREDVKNYRGDLPNIKHSGGNNSTDMGMDTMAHIGGGITGVRRVGAPKRIGVATPPQTVAPKSVVEPQPVAQTTSGLYVLKVRYVSIDGTVRGFGAIKPDGSKGKLSYEKVLQLANAGKVQSVKVVNRGNGAFLQGVGQALDTLPTKTIQ